MNRLFWNYCKAVAMFSLSSMFLSCGDSDVPDVSDIKIEMQVQRFEQDFFSIDTNNINTAFASLQAKYPVFLKDFHVNILGLPPVSDTPAAVETAIKNSYLITVQSRIRQIRYLAIFRILKMM